LAFAYSLDDGERGARMMDMYCPLCWNVLVKNGEDCECSRQECVYRYRESSSFKPFTKELAKLHKEFDAVFNASNRMILLLSVCEEANTEQTMDMIAFLAGLMSERVEKIKQYKSGGIEI